MVFAEVEIIVAAVGASRRPYGNWAVYGALAVIVKVKMLAACIV